MSPTGREPRAARRRAARPARAFALALAATSLGWTSAARADEAAPTAAVARPATSSAEAGWRVYRDPATGRLQPPPAGAGEGGRPAGATAAAQSAPLTERPSEVPGGGVLLDVHGRFDTSAVAHRDAAGAPTVDCVRSSEGQAAGGAAPAR